MPEEFEEAALDFTRLCLKQPESFIPEENWHVLQVRPDGFNSGPESFADCGSLDCEDLRMVLPLVAYWCSLNSVLLEIICSSSLQYECRFTEGDPVSQILETGGSADLCFELLYGAAEIAKRMKVVETPRPTMSRQEFIDREG